MSKHENVLKRLFNRFITLNILHRNYLFIVFYDLLYTTFFGLLSAPIDSPFNSLSCCEYSPDIEGNYDLFY